MMHRKIPAMIAMIMAMTACANNEAINDYNPIARPYLPVDISVQSDNSGSLQQLPVSGNTAHYRAYVAAMPNERYSLRVSNNSGQRVGVVIAVDGRNIINGQPSWLRNNERMYILEPNTSAEYGGWRTSANQVNRFYFTEAGNSYAAAWGDTSALGVIAMAAYTERPRPEIYEGMSNAESDAFGLAAKKGAPGTGFGETTYSPSYSVNFDPLPDPIEKVFLKYEWRETLCAKRILPDCRRSTVDTDDNRFWPADSGYAPPPPRH